MIGHLRAVTVHLVPQPANVAGEREFLRELREQVNTERPCLVLDCSNINRMNDATIHLLLCCLEEGMKRNGDVRLGALNADAASALRAAGIGRLFEMYPTTAAAVKSYQQIFTSEPGHSFQHVLAAESAA